MLWVAVFLAAGFLVCAGASFFFALAESALFSLGKWRAKQLAPTAEGQQVLQLLEKPSELLATIVLGNTLANGGMVVLALWPVMNALWPLLPTLAGATLFILVACEVLPKTLAVRAPEYWARQVSRPMTVLQQATRGLQSIAETLNSRILAWCVPASIKPHRGVTEEDYRELLDMAFQQGALAASEKEIILQILQLDRKTAMAVMKPRSSMAAIPDTLSIEEMLEAARRLKHRRLPIYDESLDTIVGVLDTQKLLLNPESDLSEVIEFPSFVPETTNLLQLLISLQRQKRGLAIVLDEYGGTAGLITPEDILEEVVGEIRSEEESSDQILERLGEGRWRASGALRLDDFRKEYPALGDAPRVDTIGGLMLLSLEAIPQPGQSTLFRNLRLTAVRADERRVHEVLIELLKRK